MTADELVALQKIGPLQTEMALHMGLSLGAYQDIEGGKSTARKLHAEAATMVSLVMAVDTGNPMLATPTVRRMALGVARIITG